MIRVNVEIENKSWLKNVNNPSKYLNNKIKKISRSLSLFKKKNLTFTILLTNSIFIKKLNKKFRKKNKHTDVLSFPFFEKNYLKKIKEKNFYIGDIAICYEIIKLRSKNKSFEKELDKVWIHGLLHLVGYDHIKNRDYLKMDSVEKKLLKIISE